MDINEEPTAQPYEAPQLIELGDFAEITLGTGTLVRPDGAAYFPS